MRVALTTRAIVIFSFALAFTRSAKTESSVLRRDPPNPRTCRLVATSPRADQNQPSDGSAAGLKPNDGAGNAGDNLREGGATADNASGRFMPIDSTRCKWAFVPTPAPAHPRWGAVDPNTNSNRQNNCDGPTRYAVAKLSPAGISAPPSSPDPAVLGGQSTARLQGPNPGIAAGPDRVTRCQPVDVARGAPAGSMRWSRPAAHR